MEQTDKISPTFCVYPWMQMILPSHSFYSLCCVSDILKDEKGKVFNLQNDRMEDVWNSQTLRDIRKKMLKGEKVNICSWCNYQESVGEISQRKNFNREFLGIKYKELNQEILDRVEKSRTNGYKVEKRPLYLDLRPGHLCNLKCRMCNAGSSSKIYQEQKKLLNKDPALSDVIETRYFQNNEKFYNWNKNKEIWKTIYKWSPDLRVLYFTGGEPTLIKENWEYIDYLIKEGYSSKIHLIFNINCTQLPDKLIETFKAFHSVEVRLSIDGFKKANEYIRHPSKWEEVENNIIKMMKNKNKTTLFHFSNVIQVYNILDLPDLIEWMEKIQDKFQVQMYPTLMICQVPTFLNIAILPKNVKEEALRKISSCEARPRAENWSGYFVEHLKTIKNSLKEEEHQDINKELKRFFKYTKMLDKERDESFEQVFPELNRLLNEDGRWRL